ncbi:MAG: hypothetical protein WCE82_03635 [Halobacteriota archaeon]
MNSPVRAGVSLYHVDASNTLSSIRSMGILAPDAREISVGGIDIQKHPIAAILRDG